MRRRAGRHSTSCRARLRRGDSGRARPLPFRWRIRSIQKRRPRRLRHDRMGRLATVVERNRRNVRAFLSRRGTVARRGGKSAAFESNGSRDDFFHAAEFFSTPAASSTAPGSIGSGSTSHRIFVLRKILLGQKPTKKRRPCGKTEHERLQQFLPLRDLRDFSKWLRFITNGSPILPQIPGGIGGTARQIRPRSLCGLKHFRMVRRSLRP